MKSTRAALLAWSIAGLILAVVATTTVLAFLNREANDWHMEVVNMIAFQGHFPEHDECSECYQPPFYYVVGAGLLRLLHLTKLGPGLIACQLLNVAAGAATLPPGCEGPDGI